MTTEQWVRAIDALDDALGSRVSVEPGDYVALREQYNLLAQAAEDAVCLIRQTQQGEG